MAHFQTLHLKEIKMNHEPLSRVECAKRSEFDEVDTQIQA